jgi:hypothetical protein
MTKSTFSSVLKVALIAVPFAAPLAVPMSAQAEPAQQFRCSTDSLDTGPGLARLEWARKCGLLTNTGGMNSWFGSLMAFDMTFNPAKDYREVSSSHAYTGNTNDYNVNFYYSFSRYVATPLYTVASETTGPTAGFWKWSHTAERPRPLYPTFEDTPVVGSGTQLFPHPDLADCNLYTDRSGSAAKRWNGSFFVGAYCESSCYTPDQSLRFSDGDVNIVEAMKAKRDDVVTLTPDATLDGLSLQTSRVYSYTTEIRDAENVIYNLTTASGGSLRVTNEHPIITSEGRIVKAEKLIIGDELLKADGTPDMITEIEKTVHFGKVYNIKPASTVPVANILIAQGYLVGSARFQNDDIDYMNRVLLFRGVPDDVMPR